MKNKRSIYLLILLWAFGMALLGQTMQVRAAENAKGRNCPMQFGWTSFQLGEHGEGVGLVDYPCDFAVPPVLVVSPAQGQGTFSVGQFQANSLTGGEGSVAVVGGTPEAWVTFSWVAGGP